MTKDELLQRLQDLEWEDFECKQAKSELPNGNLLFAIKRWSERWSERWSKRWSENGRPIADNPFVRTKFIEERTVASSWYFAISHSETHSAAQGARPTRESWWCSWWILESDHQQVIHHAFTKKTSQLVMLKNCWGAGLN